MRMGARIKQILDRRGLSQAELVGKVAELEPGTLSALIVRDSRFSEHAQEIAKALNVSLDYLLFGTESDQIEPNKTGEVSAQDITELIQLFAACDQAGRESILTLCRVQSAESNINNGNPADKRQRRS